MSNRQLHLFDNDISRLSGVVPALKSAMRKACDESNLSREQMLDQMNALAREAGIRLTGGRAQNLSLAVLDKWLAPTCREHVPPVVAILVFCRAAGSIAPLSALAGVMDYRVIDRRQGLLLKKAELNDEVKRKKREIKKLEAELNG